MNKPDYNNSLLSLISSVMKHFGVETNHKSLPYIDKLLEKNFKNIVIMLFDGMGTDIVKKHLANDEFLPRHKARDISSVFPPTTTAATTSIESGLAPIEHGWLGWTLHFDEIGKNVCLFPNTIFESGEIAEQYHVARSIIPYESVFDKIKRCTNGEIGAYCVSKFSSFNTQSVDEICDVVKQLCEQNGKKYIYTYWHQPDFDMHDYGTTSDIVHEKIVDINSKVERLCKSLKDTLVIVTADHGLIDTKWKFLAEYPDVMQYVLDTPTIEARAMSFVVEQGKHKQFEDAFKKNFGEWYELFSHEQVFEQGIFGEGKKHEHIDAFVGDYLAVATSNVSLAIGERTDDVFKAVHAGSTQGEYNVPLIIVECK